MSVRTLSRSFYGTEWRVVGRWKDLGGVDGVEYVTDLEFYRHGAWHTDESWLGETFRSIPASVSEWASIAAWSLTEREMQSRVIHTTPTPTMPPLNP